MKKISEKIDPTSDRYRECKNDQVKFMAHHRSMLFCDEQCADEFHNRKKKKEEEEKFKSEIKRTVIALPAPPDKPPPEKVPDPQEKLKQNIKFLDSQDIDSEYGSHFNMDWMHSQGYDFSAFTGQGKLHNIDPSNNCKFIQIGHYRMFRVAYSHVLIIKII